MDFETLTVSVDDAGIGRLTLDQPERLNPLGFRTLAEIADAARWFDQQRARVVIVTGAGDRAFTAGFDLADFVGSDNSADAGADLGRRMAESIERMDAVAIAAVHGHCIGGGVVLASACDMRVVADNAVFRIPEVDLGIPLAWGGIPRLVREIGPAMTRELVITCRPFDAIEAKAIGFCNRVVARAELDEAALEMARAVAARPRSVVRTTKRQIHDATEDLASTRDGWIGESLLASAGLDAEARSAARRYLENRDD